MAVLPERNVTPRRQLIVCIPYRPDTPERIGNWERTCEQWEGWIVIRADSDGETFGRSQAVNRAVETAGPKWDALVVADSDLLLEDSAQAEAALERARETNGYIVCYDTFYYLDEPNTRKVRSREVPFPTPRMAYYSLTQIWGGMFAIARGLWDATGGFDESIKTWGGEDGNFYSRMEAVDGYRDRVEGDCYHLKHPVVPGGR